MPDLVGQAALHKHSSAAEGPCRECALAKVAQIGLDRILIPLDGTAESETTLPHAAALAKSLDAEITLFHVVHPGPPFHNYRPGQVRYPDALFDRAVMLASSYLDEVSSRTVREYGVRVRSGVARGDAARMIVTRAATAGYGLIVILARPRSVFQRNIGLKVLEEVWRRTATPLLFVREKTAAQPGVGLFVPPEIIIPFDRYGVPRDAIPAASALAGVTGASIVFLTSETDQLPSGDQSPAGDTTDGHAATGAQEIAGYLREDRIPARIETLSGVSAKAIVARQAGSPGSIIVTSSHMSSGIRRTLLGSTADGVVKMARGPVIIVPDKATAERRARAIRADVEGEGTAP